MQTLEGLPVELIGEILSALELEDLITTSYLSRRLHHVSSDIQVNPWRRPILRKLRSGTYAPCLKTLSVRTSVPRHNWVDILSIASAHFLLFEATLPHLPEDDWKECFRRRFLPSMQQWKRQSSWKEVFKRALYRLWHRGTSSCTADEAWHKYIVLNKNGSANLLDAAARGFNPIAIMDELKLQSNLLDHTTRIRVLVEFADIRILVLGVCEVPSSSVYINSNAGALLRPHDTEVGQAILTMTQGPSPQASLQKARPMTHPAPAYNFRNYPLFTPGRDDRRWLSTAGMGNEGKHWLGSLMVVAQIVGPLTKRVFDESPVSKDLQLVVGPGRSQYASISWADLDAIAPWMVDHTTARVDEAGLGNQ